MKVATDPRPAPNITPIKSIACIDACWLVKSHEYKSRVKRTMMASWKMNIGRFCAALNPATPAKKITDVLITRYRDSKPRIEGVIIRLPATVWKATVARP